MAQSKRKQLSCEYNMSSCPLMPYLSLVSKKWSLEVLKLLASGDSKRFGEMARSVRGITPRVLSQRLGEFESLGIVSKEKFREAPPRVEYFLTERGKDLTRCYRPGVTHTIKQGKEPPAD